MARKRKKQRKPKYKGSLSRRDGHRSHVTWRSFQRKNGLIEFLDEQARRLEEELCNKNEIQ